MNYDIESIIIYEIKELEMVSDGCFLENKEKLLKSFDQTKCSHCQKGILKINDKNELHCSCCSYSIIF